MNDSSSAPGKPWASMTTADFDTKARSGLTLAVPPGPARVVAVQHRTGTDALFGDKPAPPAAARPKARRAPGAGQEELFDAAP
ncbi:hypothetical protein ACFW6V_39965 [Streptomyces sp. NPDC058734]|uniref:hypothetical protein n=1 Tax=Streptomyces sp. NPDC058734 TaxID=3346615 RepID=UPI0036BE705E